MTDRIGRADLHIHTIASDGTADVASILDHVAAIVAVTRSRRLPFAGTATGSSRP